MFNFNLISKFAFLSLAAIGLSSCQKTTDTAAVKQLKSQPDLTAEINEYKQWATQQIGQLLNHSEQFVSYLNAGKLQEAKKSYPITRMYFERVEPIAEVFDDLDPRIDRREADLEPGETWTGFHAIEKILWIKNTTKGTEALGKQLIADIKELKAKIPQAELSGSDLIEGAVDLLNEVSTSKITGEEEIFSKTDLYAFQANVEGAEKIFKLFKPKVTAKDPALANKLTEHFTNVYTLLNKHKNTGDYKPYNQLSDKDTRELAEAIHKLGEPLAQMGIILQ